MQNEGSRRVFPEERRQFISELIAEKGRATVQELTERFDVSPVTIRGDLDLLEQEGVIKRTHGGAIALSTDKSRADHEFLEREEFQIAEKQRIGAAGAELVQNGMTVLIDASTTALQVARNLRKHRDIVVITNCPPAVMEFGDAPGVTVMMLGGTVRKSSWSVVGPWVDRFLSEVNVDIAFVGCKGITARHGLMDINAFIVETKRSFVRAAHQVVCVADHQKWGRRAFASFASVEELSAIITDIDAPAHEVEEVRALGIDVRTV